MIASTRAGRLAAVLIAGGALLGASPAWADKTVKLRIATQAPKGTVWMVAMEDIARIVKQKTGGDVELKFYPNGNLGDENAVIEKLKSHAIEGGLFTGIGLGHPEMAPRVRLLELPFKYRDAAEIDVVKHAFEAEYKDDFRRKGYVFMGWAEVGQAFVFTQNRAASLEELRKQKVWQWDMDPLVKETFDAARMNGVALSLTDVLTSLQNGLINGCYNSPYGLIGLQWHPKVRFMSDVAVGWGTGGLVLTEAALKSIPKKHRETVERVCWERCEQLVAELRTANVQAIDDLKQQGIEVVNVPPEDVKELEAAGKVVEKRMVPSHYSQQDLDRVNALIDEHRRSAASSPPAGP